MPLEALPAAPGPPIRRTGHSPAEGRPWALALGPFACGTPTTWDFIPLKAAADRRCSLRTGCTSLSLVKRRREDEAPSPETQPVGGGAQPQGAERVPLGVGGVGGGAFLSGELSAGRWECPVPADTLRSPLTPHGPR